MALLIVFLLLLTGFILTVMNKRKSAILTLGGSLLWLCLVGQGPVTALLLSLLQTRPQLHSPEWKESNAIVILGAGTYRRLGPDPFLTHPLGLPRIHEGARLYHLCRKTRAFCKVITSGGDVQGLGISEGDLMKKDLRSLAVPEEDILAEGKSFNTFENAKYTKELLKAHQFEQLLLVTSGFHMARSLEIFEHFKLNVLPAPADHLNARFSLFPRGSNFYWADLALHEIAGTIKLRVWNFLGLEY